MLRRAPDRVRSVNAVMAACWLPNRCAAARTASSVPPTLTIAMPSTVSLMLFLDTAFGTRSSISRLDRSITDIFCTTGRTKTPAPMTTFCPARSSPLLLRPVMSRASLGLATLYRETTARTEMMTSATRATTPRTTGLRPNTWSSVLGW